MSQPTAIIRINTSYVTERIAQQYVRNLELVLNREFPDWDVTIIPGAVDAVEVPIADSYSLENFQIERRVRDLMTESLMKSVDDCKYDRDLR